MASLLLGNHEGTGNLLQLQKSAVDKFVVNNAGNTKSAGKWVPVTEGASPMSIQSGTVCDTTDGSLSVTFSPAFAATPVVTVGQTSGTLVQFLITGATTGWSASFAGNGTASDQCWDWIAIGVK